MYNYSTSASHSYHPGVGGLSKDPNKALLQEAYKKLKLKKQQTGHAIQASPRREWTHPKTSIPFHRLGKLVNRIDALENIIGEKPKDWKKPTYGNLDYTIAHCMGWISDEEEGRDRVIYEQRRERSLQSCHRYALKWDALPENPAENTGGGYTPQVSSTILNDNRLTSGSKIMAMKIMEEAYKKNREGRWLQITVTYLMKALGRCRRTIQNYLRLLETLGYIKTDVINGKKSRMCIGLAIWLQEALFPEHHKEKWPQKRAIPGAQIDSYNGPPCILRGKVHTSVLNIRV